MNISPKSSQHGVRALAIEGVDEKDQGIDVPELGRFLLRRRKTILIVAALTGAILCGIGLGLEKKYAAKAVVMISPQQQSDSIVRGGDGAVDPDSGFVDSQIEIMQSPKIIDSVITQMALTRSPEWNGSKNWRLPPELAGLLQVFGAEIEKRTRDEIQGTTASRLAKAISVRRKGLSYVIEIKARAREPREAAAIANAVVHNYLNVKVEQRVGASIESNKWLSERLSVLKNEVQRKEAAVEAYRAQSGLLTADGASLTEQQITALQGSVVSARADLAERQARLSMVQGLESSGSAADTIAASLNSDTIRNLRMQESEIVRRQAELETRYGDQHPAVTQVRVERAGVERQIASEIERISANVRNEFEVAQARLAALERNLSTMRAQMVSNNAESVKLRELERDSSATRAVYEAFLARYQEATETASFKVTDARLVAPATPPVKPDRLPAAFIVLQAIGAGLVLGLLVGLIADLMDDVLHNGETGERRLGISSLASIPLLRPSDLRQLPVLERHPAAYIVEKPMSRFAEALRSLRTAIAYPDSGSTVKVVCVTSAVPNEGKTTTALCLARVAAMAGQKVILVDCDLRRRTLNTILGLEPRYGLPDVLYGRAQWQDVILPDTLTNLNIMPVVEAPFSPRDVFGSSAWRDLIEQLRGAYDLVVLDSPPVLAVAEARIIARFAEKTVIIVRWSKTSTNLVRAAVEHLEKSGSDIAGFTLNFVDPRKAGRLVHSDLAYHLDQTAKYYAT